MQLQLVNDRIRNRVIARKGNEHLNLLLSDVALFYSESKIAFLIDKDGNKYMTDRNLTDLENKLDQNTFFRANRQYIININFIKSFKTYERSKIWVNLIIDHEEHKIIISQETAPFFRRWIYEA
jgi:DNA-binding LytR/AlgR family response regulator